jgi:LuxR family transcriptional regulator, maltose regulon positive regulatory protein
MQSRAGTTSKDADAAREVVPARRRIIERSRLTRLLDGADARIIMLVAPAGYGKTTLARQWLMGKAHDWYRTTSASSDIAALALGVVAALSSSNAQTVNRVRERLRATTEPAREPQVFADLVASGFDDVSEERLLAIDDYHLLMPSAAAEVFMERVIETWPGRILLATRERPSWATARRILYGELYEIGPIPLAMSEQEAEEVLPEMQGGRAHGLVAVAHGWPAVIGLAAISGYETLPDRDLPGTLYEFFAEELYQAATPFERNALTKLALIPSLDARTANSVLACDAAAVISDGLRIGFLAPSQDGSIEFHPLARDFLTSDATQLRAGLRDDDLERIALILANDCRWDDAFDVIVSASSVDGIIDLIHRALYPLLAEGRLATLTNWIKRARDRRLTSGIIDLAEAEVAFRKGRAIQAEALALQAARRLSPGEPLRARSFCVAGQAARQGNRDVDALHHFRSARGDAKSRADLREALWGQLITTPASETDTIEKTLHDLQSIDPTDGSDALRSATAHWIVASRTGAGLERAIRKMTAAAPLEPHADDPVVRTSFLNAYARALALAAEYQRAAEVVDRLLSTALQYRLDFAIAPAYTAKAIAAIGRKSYREAALVLDRSEDSASRLDDDHNVFEARAVRSRLLTAQQRFSEAIAVKCPEPTQDLPPGLLGEAYASRALALAGLGRLEDAESLAGDAVAMTRALEATGFASCTLMVVKALRKTLGPDAVGRWFETIRSRHYFDSFVVTYRAFPQLLRMLNGDERLRSAVAIVAARVGDAGLAREAGLAVAASFRHESAVRLSLSRREWEVFELLGQGRSNREIATTLCITEVTVKVHVRHILHKLGVRSRTEAAVLLSR